MDRIELTGEILALLREFDLPSTALTIEITEGAIALNQASSNGVLKDLRSAGIFISLDDFGTGYSALNMLDSLPLDEIKLDRSFAASLLSERTRDVVFQTVTLARKLNLSVVAEGIEETSQLEVARKLGCDLFQGYLIAPPLDYGMATQFIVSQTTNPLLPEPGQTHSECSAAAESNLTGSQGIHQ